MNRFAIYSTAMVFAGALALPYSAFAQGSSAGSGNTNSPGYGSSSSDSARPGIGGAPDNGSGNGQPMKSGASATGNTSGSGTSEWTTRKGNPVAGERNPGDSNSSPSGTGSDNSR